MENHTHANTRTAHERMHEYRRFLYNPHYNTYTTYVLVVVACKQTQPQVITWKVNQYHMHSAFKLLTKYDILLSIRMVFSEFMNVVLLHLCIDRERMICLKMLGGTHSCAVLCYILDVLSFTAWAALCFDCAHNWFSIYFVVHTIYCLTFEGNNGARNEWMNEWMIGCANVPMCHASCGLLSWPIRYEYENTNVYTINVCFCSAVLPIDDFVIWPNSMQSFDDYNRKYPKGHPVVNNASLYKIICWDDLCPKILSINHYRVTVAAVVAAGCWQISSSHLYGSPERVGEPRMRFQHL